MIYVKNLMGQKVWTFPKGHPEKKEKPIESALREVREETGWLCRGGKKLMDVHYSYSHDGFLIKKTVRWFLMTPVKKAGDFDTEEIIRCRWYSLSQARKKVTYLSDQKILSKFKIPSLTL